jgi:hypothetical protein
VIGHDSRGHDQRRICLQGPARAQAHQQLVEVVLVVRRELADHLLQLLQHDFLGNIQSCRHHRPHRVDAGTLGELGGRVQRVVDVEQDGLQALHRIRDCDDLSEAGQTEPAPLAAAARIAVALGFFLVPRWRPRQRGLPAYFVPCATASFTSVIHARSRIIKPFFSSS